MIGFSISAGRVYKEPEMLKGPHFAARQAIPEVPNVEHGPVRMQSCFPRLSETPSSIHRAALRLPAEHNVEVFGERLALGA